MDIFILDSLLRPIDVVDEFVSIIWTERFAEKGDFELVTLSSPSNRKRFVFDTMISIPDSKRIMRIKTIEEVDDSEKGPILKIKGYDLVTILNERTAVQISPSTSHPRPVWNLYGWSPVIAMQKMVFDICYDGDMSPHDIIPFLQSVGTPSLYPDDTIPDLPESMVWSQKPASLYSAVVDVAQAYDIGFRLYKDPNSSKLYFEGYTGSDRTSAQTLLPPVIFSDDMSNLKNTTEYSDNTLHYNAVRTIYHYKDEFDNDVTFSNIVIDDEYPGTVSGFDRKVKVLNITAIPEDVTDMPFYLQQLGFEELNRSRPVSIFDGEIDQEGEYVYEQDYFLGDLVEIRGKNGGTAYMRVVEQIIKEDSSGKSSYPSLVTKTSINPGTWLSWKYDVEWSAMGSEEYWSNQ